MSGLLVKVLADPVVLEGSVELPTGAIGTVVFSHGSGSGRHSPRNRFVAETLRRGKLATLLLDLLTPDEDREVENRFDIDLLTERLDHAVRFVRAHAPTRALPPQAAGPWAQPNQGRRGQADPQAAPAPRRAARGQHRGGRHASPVRPARDYAWCLPTLTRFACGPSAASSSMNWTSVPAARSSKVGCATFSRLK